METTTATKTAPVTVNTETTVTRGFWDMLEFNRMGVIPILLLIIGCVGGIAAGFGALSDLLRISLVAFPTIISLALILAVAPMRAVVFSVALAVVCDLIALVLGYPFFG